MLVGTLLTKIFYGLFTQNITVENYDEDVTTLNEAVGRAVTNEEEQTTGNLAVVADFFSRSARLITDNMIIIMEGVSSLISYLRMITSWV